VFAITLSFILSAAPSLDVPGGKLTQADLETLGPTTAEWTSHGEKKHPGDRKVLLATGADGYTAVFRTAELVEAIGPTRALRVWKIDGKPLPKEQGDFRLVVLTDKEGARCVYQLVKLELIDVSGIGTPASAR